MDDTIAQELYFLIFKYLDNGPCKKAAEAIKEEIEKYNLLPKRIDWLGNEHPLDFDTFESRNTHIKNDFLLKIVSRIGALLNHHIPSSIQSVNTLLGSGSQSLLRTSSDINHHNESHFLFTRLHHAPLKPSSKKAHPYSQNIVNILNARQACGPSPITSILPTYLYEKFIRCKRLLGHLACVYCVSFDRTGRYIFTGADDTLIKIWSAEDGRLLATLRGHSSEISDIAVNYENTLLASGSLDKMIRVWCIKTTSPVCVLTGHTGMITSLSFCPYSKNNDRYLVSTSNDGSICFWRWNVKTRQFNPEPIKKIERMKQSAHLLCFSFSSGGSFLAVGSSDHYVRVYHVSNPSGPNKVLEIQPHLDQVDSLQFSNRGLRFISGSKDGTANIWKYERSEWHSKTLHMNETLPISQSTNNNPDQVIVKLKVTMVGWSLDDQYVITAVNDHSIKVWESNTGKLKYILKEHDDEVFVIETHPTDPRLFLSGGHDGKIFLWDLSTGKHIKMFFNQITGQGYGSIFDCKWSPDGSMFTCTDSHGHLSIFAMGSDEKYKKVPDEVFFHTDYRPLIRDVHHFVIDEQTQCAPHLMPPPFLVDIDGNPYPPALQRLVPGREHCKDEDQLVPYIAIQHERGVAEILDPRENNNQAQQPSNSNNNDLNNSLMMNNSSDNLMPNSINYNDNQRPTIDDMIERLQQEQDRHRVNEEHRYAANSLTSNDQQRLLLPAASSAADQSFLSSNRPGVRRSGDVEGVRQSTGNWQSRGGNLNSFHINPRKYVTPLPVHELKSCYNKLNNYSELEEETYQTEARRKPLSTAATLKELSNKGRLTRRKKRIVIQRRGINEQNTNNNSSNNRSILNTNEEEPSIQSDDSDDASFSIGAVESWQESSSSSENSTDSSDDDWQFSRSDPRSNRTKRKSQRSTRNNVDDNNSDTDEPHQPARSSNRLSSRENNFEDHNNEPSTSSGVLKKLTKATRKANKDRIQENLKNLPQEMTYKPPEWLTEVMPKRTPYFPQIGDEIIYFKKGHSLYNEAVRNAKLYGLSHKIPLLNNRHIVDEQLVKVKDISYEIRPPTLVSLTLAIVDNETGEELDEKHTFKYHDMKNVIDFLVLKQFYDQSIEHGWKPNDRFRSVIDNQWWFGVIKSIEEDEDEVYKNSKFQTIKVLWDNKEEEAMSAWDLEPCTERFPENHVQGLSLTEEERERLMYQPEPNDWPECGRDIECERLIRGLEKIMQTAWAESFNAPVDLNEYPDYGKMIAYPIDLSTIKSRLENRFYRRIDAVKFDVVFIEKNAREYNEPFSVITRNAKIVTYLFTQFIDRQDLEDPTVITQEIQQNKEMFESTESESEDEYIETRTGKKSKKRNEPRWISESRHLLAELFRNVDSEPFRNPVDLNEYEDYLEKVSTPMDLSTIKEQLLSGVYEDPKDLNKDLKLIFQNSKIYNTDKRAMIYAMTLRLQSLVNEKMKNILNNHKQEQMHGNKKSTKIKVVNGVKTRKRTVDRNSSAETSGSRYSSRNEQNHYTNGHDKPTTSRSKYEEENSNDEEYHPSLNLKTIKIELSNQLNVRPKRKSKPISYSDDEETDLEKSEEDEEKFDISIDEATELDEEEEENVSDEQTEDQTDEDDSFKKKNNRLVNGNRQSLKRKKGRKRTCRRSMKKMKLTNGSSYKGRKTSLTTESDQNTSLSESSATDIERSIQNENSRRGRSANSNNKKSNKNDKYGLRKSKRRKFVDYAELNGSDEYEGPVQTVSSRGRVRKMKSYR